MTPIYTCIFYMAGDVGNWSSQHEILITDDPTEISARLAHFHHHNETCKDGQFEIYLLINGRDEYWATDEELGLIEAVQKMVFANLEQLRAQAEARKIEKAKEVEAVAKKAAEAIERTEKKLLAELKKKYES